MPTPDPATRCFVGDLTDPWVSAIASAVAPPRFDVACPGDFPEIWPAEAQAARTLILHRPNLTTTDAERLRALRGRNGGPPRVILCAGPNVRYHQLERWSPLVDVLLSEATAAEVVCRHLQENPSRPRPDGPHPAVSIASTNLDMRGMLADACRTFGHDVIDGDFAAHPAGSIVIWDVPILEDDWEARLRGLAGRNRVIALMGFPDRLIVSRARAAGAFACLELPSDPADLAFVLDRAAVTSFRIKTGHDVPPEPIGLKFAKNGSAIAGRRPDSYNPDGA